MRNYQLLQDIMDYSPALIVTVDPKSRFISVNAHFAALFGQKPDDFIGKDLDNFLSPEIALQHHKNDLRVIEQGHSLAFEEQNEERDGIHCYSTIKFPMRDENGKIYGVTGISTDISERKKIEKDLLQERTLLEAIFASVPGMLYLYDEDGKLIRWNKNHETMSGYSPEELSGMNLMDWYKGDAESQKAVLDGLGATKSNVFGYAEANLQRKDGTVIPMYFTACPLKINGKEYFAGIGIDITERKRAENALRESENRFMNLFERAPIGYQTLDKNGVFIEINEATLSTLGYRRDQLLGKWFGDFVAPEYVEEFNERFRFLMTAGKVYFELEMMHASGKKIIISFEGKIGYKKDKSFDRILCIMQDITNRKGVERALHENEEKYRKLLEFAPDAFFQGDAQGNFITVNDKAVEMTGYSKEKLLTMHMSDLFSPQENNEKPLRYDLLKNDAVLKNEREIHKQNGEILNVEMSSRAMPDGTMQCFMRDLTGRKQAEKELLKVSQMQTLILNNSTVGIAFVRNRIFEWLNPRMCELFRFDIDEMKGAPTRIIYPNEESYKRIETDVYPLFAQKKSAPIELEMVRSDGSLFWCRVEGSVLDITNPHGGSIWIWEDITERKQAESEKEKLQQQLSQSQKLESIGRLAGGVAHDYNNMLGVIIGYSELALDKIPPTQDVYNDLKEILNAAKRSANITKQLLAFARKQVIAPEVINLNAIVDGMLKMVRYLIGEDVKLIWHPGEELGKVKMDPSQIDQILANLCVNARDAITGVGTITIETCPVTVSEEESAEQGYLQSGEFVLLTVSDDGCGMDEETLSHIFEPFFTTKKLGQGTGLGLATVYGIVKQNKGMIDVHSESGKGTTFKVFIPRYTEEAQNKIEDRKKEADTPLSRGETILVVEDEPALLEMVKIMLEAFGYKIIAANDGMEALRIAEDFPGTIDLLITDVIMPEMNGRDLSVRLLKFYPFAKLLFISGYTAQVIEQRGELDEGVQFLQKPFSSKQLAACVRAILDAPREK